MGVYYNLYVVPEPEHMEFVPTGGVVNALVESLQDLGWAQREESYAAWDGGEGRQVAESSRAAALDALAGAGAAFAVRLKGMPGEHWWPQGHLRDDGLSRKYDLSGETAGVFSARYCDEICLAWSPELVAVPQDAYDGSEVACPTCGSNVLRELDGDRRELAALSWADITKQPPRECGTCATVLNLAALTASPSEGSGFVAERAPFAHLLVVIRPAPKATPTVHPQAIDPELLTRMADVTGVRFRSIGRFA